MADHSPVFNAVRNEYRFIHMVPVQLRGSVFSTGTNLSHHKYIYILRFISEALSELHPNLDSNFGDEKASGQIDGFDLLIVHSFIPFF